MGEKPPRQGGDGAMGGCRARISESLEDDRVVAGSHHRQHVIVVLRRRPRSKVTPPMSMDSMASAGTGAGRKPSPRTGRG